MNHVRLLSLIVISVHLGCGFDRSQPKQEASSSAEAVSAQAPIVASTKIEKLESQHLPNPVRVHEKVISGGLPAGEIAFAELKAWGIQTVISVDGAKPDVAAAEKYGMRYVHLPHGYDGIPEQRAKELAKAVRDLPGPIYLHCHHGKHRSPAAAAVACVGAGLLPHDQAAAVLQVAGTSEAYRGLFQSALAAQRFEATMLDELQAEFPSTAKLPVMAERMVEIEHVYDRLKAIEQAGWQTPDSSPSFEPAHEALLLREHFTEMLRSNESLQKPESFRLLVQDAESKSRALEQALNNRSDGESLSRLFSAIGSNCQECHRLFRDVPLSEKR